MPRNAVSLDARLYTISALCAGYDRFADIGTDHGRLGAYLLQTGGCRTAEFADISGPSLEKARRLISMLGLSSRAVFSVGDGALALKEKPDSAVIAGMGGETIAGIVARGKDILEGARLVLQPNVDAPKVRRALSENGFAITDERVVRDGRRLYVIIAADAGRSEYDEFELNVGPVLMKTRPDTLFEFADFRLRVAKKALVGIAAGGYDPSETEHEIKIWEEVAQWRT